MDFNKLRKYIIIVPILLIIIICLVVFIEKTKKVDSHTSSIDKIRFRMPDEFDEREKEEHRTWNAFEGQVNEFVGYYIYEASDEDCTIEIRAFDYTSAVDGAFDDYKEKVLNANSIEPVLVIMQWDNYNGYIPSTLSTKKINRNDWMTFTLEKENYDGLSKYYYYACSYDQTIYILEFRHDTKYDYDKKSYCSKSLNTITNSIYFR